MQLDFVTPGSGRATTQEARETADTARHQPQRSGQRYGRHGDAVELGDGCRRRRRGRGTGRGPEQHGLRRTTPRIVAFDHVQYESPPVLQETAVPPGVSCSVSSSVPVPFKPEYTGSASRSVPPGLLLEYE